VEAISTFAWRWGGRRRVGPFAAWNTGAHLICASVCIRLHPPYIKGMDDDGATGRVATTVMADQRTQTTHSLRYKPSLAPRVEAVIAALTKRFGVANLSRNDLFLTVFMRGLESYERELGIEPPTE
jgi:hypothetical protein